MGQMLPIAVRTDHAARQSGLLDIPEPRLQGESFSEIDRMGQDGTAVRFGNVENALVSRAAAVIHKDNRAKLVVAELFN
ncbi:hypothetical protein D3C85_1740090 [compost metagenome]